MGHMKITIAIKICTMYLTFEWNGYIYIAWKNSYEGKD